MMRKASTDQRNRIWRHNSFLGHATMIMRQANNIAYADSTNREAKVIANEIARLAEELLIQLKERID